MPLFQVGVVGHVVIEAKDSDMAKKIVNGAFASKAPWLRADYSGATRITTLGEAAASLGLTYPEAVGE